MTNPNDPWGQRPEEAPTEHLGPPGKSGYEQPLHTTDYDEAYGRTPGAPSQYPATEQFAQWAPPLNPTRELPTYESQTYESQWGAYGSPWTGGPEQPPGGVPPNVVSPGGPVPPKRNTGLWVALALGVVMLIAVAGIAAGPLVGGRNAATDTAGTTTAAPTATGSRTGTAPSGHQSPTVLPSLPVLPGLEGIGTTMGTITANDGATLTVRTITGSSVTVRTDANTEVISLSGTKVADLPVGDMIMVQGDRAQDGSVQAEIIVSTSLPGGPR